MEKRLLLAALLSLGILLLWEWIGPRPPRRAPLPVPTPGALVLPTPAASAEPSPSPGTVRIAGTQEGLTTLENDVARATFSNRGAVLTSFVLLKHTDEQKRPLELVRNLPDPAAKPLAVVFPSKPDLTRLSSSALYAVESGPGRTVRFQYGDERLTVTKEVRLLDGYLFDVRVSVAGPEFALLVGTGLRNPTVMSDPWMLIQEKSTTEANTDTCNTREPTNGFPSDSGCSRMSMCEVISVFFCPLNPRAGSQHSL